MSWNSDEVAELQHKLNEMEKTRQVWMARCDRLRGALISMVTEAPSADELRLLCVGVNGPGMQPGNENGKALHARCDRLKVARDVAYKVIEETNP